MNTKMKNNPNVKLPALTPENREMILFDLLEGNFSDADADKVMMHIEQNDDWQQEWELMQQCVLEPEHDIVYAHKAALLKSADDTKVVIFPLKRFYWAAAASIVLMASWFIFRSEEPKQNNFPVASHPPVINKDTLAKPYFQDEPVIAVNPETPSTAPSVGKPAQQAPPRQEEPIQVVNTTPKPELRDLMHRIPDLNPENTPIATETLTAAFAMAPAIVEADKTWTVTGVKSMIKDEWQQLTQPYSNPKLTFRRGVSKNNPVVWVTLTTQAYEANATLILKTNHQNP